MPLKGDAEAQLVAGSVEDPNKDACTEVQPGPDVRGGMQEPQSRAGGGEAMPQQQEKEQHAEDTTSSAAHMLLDPSLDALRTALAGIQIPVSTVSVSSPIPSDTRQQPYAANLLDFQLRGEGALEGSSGCRISRIELAAVSSFFAGLATHQQPSGSLNLPVGHAGVEMLVEAVYTQRIRLDGDSVLDLLQAASYLQVECCLAAGGTFLLEHVLHQCPDHVLQVARSLDLQAVQEWMTSV